MKHQKDIARFIQNGDYEETPEGLLIHRSILAHRGMFYDSINGEPLQFAGSNLIPAEGIAHFLNVVLGADAKIGTWYITLFGGNVTPASNWTAANFAATASEITSLTEGFSNATRPEWVDAPAAGGKIGNLAAKATFNIVCASTLNVYGAGVLSSNVRGGASGVLISASRFDEMRSLPNGTVYDLGYEVELTDS